MKAYELVSRAVKQSDRILLLGYSGWFGTSALELLKGTGAQILGSNSNGLKMLADGPKNTYTNAFQGCYDFEPTIVIDSAFLTREKIEILGTPTYTSTNRALIYEAISLSELTSVEKFIGISSGAATQLATSSSSAMHGDPYGALKFEYENLLMATGSRVKEGAVLLRAWSMSGPHVRNPNLFAFFDLIKQSKGKTMHVTSSAHVYRRYSDVEDLLSIGLASSTGGNPVDSGGELIEIGELAKTIKEVLGSDAAILRNTTSENDDHYYSEGESWIHATTELGLTPKTLREQIAYSSLCF